MSLKFPKLLSLVCVLSLLLVMAVSAESGRLQLQEDSLSVNGQQEKVVVDSKAPLFVPQNAKIVRDRYIVVFKDGVSRRIARSVIRNVRSNSGTKVHHVYSKAINGFAVTMPENVVNGLRNNKNVSYVEADQEVSTFETWGLDRVDQRDLPLSNSFTPGEDGTGVHAYIVDTGIKLAHGEFTGRMGNGFDAVSTNGDADDCNGHGTHVAGTVGGTTYGVAKNVTLHPVRVLNCQGSGTMSGVVAGIDWVTANAIKPAVANMSLGGGYSASENQSVANSVASGVSYAVAAGNENQDACNVSPASESSAVTVGASDNTDTRASFSNFGSCVDVFAPGVDITSAWHTNNSSVNTISGTSMASPHVAGVMALYLGQNPNASTNQVFSFITGNATTGHLNDCKGSPDLLLYWGSASDTGDVDGVPCDGGGTGGGGDNFVTGTLTGSGDVDEYTYSAGSGTHTLTLAGPSYSDFDLYLYEWQRNRWRTRASSTSYTSDEMIQYSDSGGDYKIEVKSYSGSGDYTLYYDLP